MGEGWYRPSATPNPIARYGEGSSHGMVFIIQATSAVDRSKWGAVRCGMAQRRGKANFCNWWAVEGPLGWGSRVREFNPPVHQLKPSFPPTHPFFGSPAPSCTMNTVIYTEITVRFLLFLRRIEKASKAENWDYNYRKIWEQKRAQNI